MLFRDAQGVNFGKIYAKQIFNPPAFAEARKTITGEGKDYVLSKGPYQISGQTSLQETVKSKQNFLAGDFKRSYIFNNAVGSDKFGVSQRASIATLHTTGDKFQTEINDYKLFLDDPEELPRLSILDNYKQIMRIMNKQYINSAQDERKFGSLGQLNTELSKDPEYLNYMEERQNTMKMSTILKNLNSPKKKRRAVEALRA